MVSQAPKQVLVAWLLLGPKDKKIFFPHNQNPIGFFLAQLQKYTGNSRHFELISIRRISSGDPEKSIAKH
jgi:hypothetical protein